MLFFLCIHNISKHATGWEGGKKIHAFLNEFAVSSRLRSELLCILEPLEQMEKMIIWKSSNCRFFFNVIWDTKSTNAEVINQSVKRRLLIINLLLKSFLKRKCQECSGSNFSNRKTFSLNIVEFWIWVRGNWGCHFYNIFWDFISQDKLNYSKKTSAD